jgi:SAM-dependent methyltransferase
MTAYDARFYRSLDSSAEPSARKIVPLLLRLVPCRSVADIGCGDGGWLAAFRAAGIDDILGFDGPWVDAALLKIPTDRFRCADLAAPVKAERRFDIAMSLEVAEHLAAERAGTFVADLVALAPVVLFSAAVPGQGGVHHVNEQWPAYWTALFKAHGYRGLDLLRPMIWNDSSISWWYRQNLVLFAAEHVIAGNEKLAALVSSAPDEPPALVHPELLSIVLKRSRPSFGRWLRMLPDALGWSDRS